MRIGRRHKTGVEVQGSRGSRIPGVLVAAIIVLAVMLGGKLGSDWQKSNAQKENHRREITSDILHQQIEQIGELATVDYYYTNMGKFEDVIQFFEHDIPFTTKSFILSYDGQMKAGIDLSMVEIRMEGQNIYVTLPEAKILSHEVDLDHFVIYDEKNSIFNGLDVEDVTGFLGQQKQVMEEKAIHNGLLEQGQKTAQQVLEKFLSNFLLSNETEYELFFCEPVNSSETQNE